MFREDTFLKLEEFNLVFYDGGLGDAICRLSVIKYITEQCPHVTLHIWVPDYFVDFARHAFPSLDINKYSDKFKYKGRLKVLNAGSQHHSSMKTHLVDHAFHVLVDRQVEIEHKNYVQVDTSNLDISKFALPEKYVVISAGHTAKVREFIPKTMNKVSRYIYDKGYTPVFLGNEDTKTGAGDDIKGNLNSDIDFSYGVNLINKTSLLEAQAIIARSKFIIGVDSGLHHVAGTTQVPIVMGFTTVESRLRVPYRNNELGWNCYPIEIPQEKLSCSGCQSRWTLVYGHDFRSCYFEDRKCVELLNFDMYKKEIDKIYEV